MALISPAGRLWSCCGGGCCYITSDKDKQFSDKFERPNDRLYNIVSNPLPFCRAGLTLIPETSHIRPNIHFYDKAEMNERILILRQLKCLVLPNGIVPLKIHQDQGDKLRG